MRATELRIISGVSAAHFLSHFYFLLLPPVFLWVRADYNVSYTELGLALAVFNGVSAVFQTPAGILADRIGPYTVLVAGLVLEAIAFALVGLVHSYWFLVGDVRASPASPTPYSIRPTTRCCRITSPRSASARRFRFTPFPGMLGNSVAPATVLLLQAVVGWRGAFIASAILGLVVAALLVLQRDDYADGPHIAARGRRRETRHRLVAADVRADHAQLRVFRRAGGGQCRHSELFRRRAQRGLRHAAGTRQHRADRATCC